MKSEFGSASFVGLISDTHGLLRPEAVAALQGSDLIVHAGDVGESQILDQLRKIAPVIAVRGNIDTGSWASELPTTALLQLGSAVVYVVHDVHDLDPDLLAPSEVDIVISGHSHRPGSTVQSGILYLNPGSAGPRRFSLPVTTGRLGVSRPPWSFDLVNLLPR